MKSFAFAAIIAATNALDSAELNYINYCAKFNKMANDVNVFTERLAIYNETEAFI